MQMRVINHQQDDVRAFYAQLRGEVFVGIEASGYSHWFEAMLVEQGHQVWVDDATEIRHLAKRRQKTDRRDADHIMDLLLRGEFPRLHRAVFIDAIVPTGSDNSRHAQRQR